MTTSIDGSAHTIRLLVLELAKTPPRLKRVHRVWLYNLPPYDAAAFARVAERCGAMSRPERDALVREAQLAGHDGVLKPWENRSPAQRSRWGTD